MERKNLYEHLYRWYAIHHRELPWRETTDPYRIWLSEIILQQTRVTQGLEYYLRFTEAFPTVANLASADEDRVLRLWQGLGYYSRARNLHKAAKQIVASSSYPEKPFPDTYSDLVKLPGVGAYTAGAIAAFAFNLPHPALDGNVYRVLSRLFDCDIAFDTSAGKKHFHEIAEQLLDRTNPRLFDSAIMELGALHCIPQHPDCAQCPLHEECMAYANDTVELLPVRKARPKVSERELIYLFYITPMRETLIHQRPTGDIWAHLWELVPADSSTPSPTAYIPTIPRDARPIQFTHVLSHQRIKASFYTIPVEQLPDIDGCRRVTLNQLDDFGFSRLTLRFFEAVFQ